MAWRQRHLVDQRRVPGRDDQPPRIRIAFDHLHQLGDLVDRLAIGCRPVTPLVTVDRPQLAILVGPLVPDAHAVFLQVAHIGVALQEPQQFVDDGFEVALLGGHQRETVGQIEAHLVAEHAIGSGAGAIALESAVLAHMAHQVEILFHRWARSGRRGAVKGNLRIVRAGARLVLRLATSRAAWLRQTP